MSKTATQKGLTAIAAIVFLFLAIPASAETDLENRIQMLEQELKLIREQLQSEVKSAQESTTAPKKKGFSTLPGWSAGYRYNFDADDNSATRLRLFLKRKSLAGSIVKLAWERQTGTIPNFFKTGTIDGNSLNKFGTFYIEQEYKF